MVKCDIKGCKKKAEVFGQTLKFCREHWNKITGKKTEENPETFEERY